MAFYLSPILYFILYGCAHPLELVSAFLPPQVGIANLRHNCNHHTAAINPLLLSPSNKGLDSLPSISTFTSTTLQAKRGESIDLKTELTAYLKVREEQRADEEAQKYVKLSRKEVIQSELNNLLLVPLFNLFLYRSQTNLVSIHDLHCLPLSRVV